jgi:predicted outer membrane protein
VNKFLLSMAVTAVVYCGSLLSVFGGARQNDTFLDKAIEASVTEIELGKLAELKADDPRIKAYATMLVKDHTKALNRLQRSQDTAQSDGTVLSLEHRELRDRLSQLSGPDFDNAYLNAIIEEHRKDIREFEREAQSKSTKSTDSISDSSTVTREKPGPVTGAQNKAIAREVLPMLRMQLQQGIDLQQKTSGSRKPQNN